MAFIRYNANPYKNDTIDCVLRGISLLMNISWDEAYIRLFIKGFQEKEVFTRNNVWIDFLLENNYEQFLVPNTCPDCITVDKFAKGHPEGRFLLGTGTHVIAVIDGNYYDTWDSGEELPLYYFKERSCYD